MPKNILIVGCGDTGKRVISRLDQDSHTISVTSHRPESQKALRSLNVNVLESNLDEIESLSTLKTIDANVFYFAPPASKGISDNRMENFIHTLETKKPPNRIVYISTSGVYGNTDGQWITEKSELNPGNDRSKRRLHAETLLQAFCKKSHCEYVILRVTGIYCREKLPLDRLKAGMKVLDPAIAPSSNRIHSDDLANCCVKAMFESPANEIYNVADGNPSSISDYFIQIAKIFDLPQPKLLDWESAEKEISPAMLSYLHESKKINVDKLLNQLNITLEHPTLIEGLQACHRQQIKN